MPPRLQYFNALRSFRQSDLCLKLAFSTTAKASAEKSSSSALDLLSSIGDEPSMRSASSRKPLPAGNANANRRVLNLIGQASLKQNRRSPQPSQDTVQELRNHKLASDLGRQITRRWKAGDVYAPHDLSPAEMDKWRKRGRPEYDAFDLLDMNPVDEYRNFSIMSEYMTPMGRIKPITETGLRRVNQRKIAKAIRRGIGLGMMPSVHRHPELLYNESARRGEQMRRSRGFRA